MEEMRKEMETRRQEFGQGRAPLLAKLSFGTSFGSFDPKTGTASSSHRYLDGDTSVMETMRRHKGHELHIIERISLQGSNLVYKHEITAQATSAMSGKSRSIFRRPAKDKQNSGCYTDVLNSCQKRPPNKSARTVTALVIGTLKESKA
jgi:hypothetical protein